MKTLYLFLLFFVRSLCGQCTSNQFSYSSTCLTQCPSGYYGDYTTMTCIACSASCSECVGSSSTACTACAGSNSLDRNSGTCISSCLLTLGLTYSSSNGQCVGSCILGDYASSGAVLCGSCSGGSTPQSGTQCLTCDPSCGGTCWEAGNSNSCSTCQSGYYLNPVTSDGSSTSIMTGICINTIPAGKWNDSGVLMYCDSSCTTCDGGNSNNCLTCPTGIYYLTTNSIDGICTASCPSNYYTNTGN